MAQDVALDRDALYYPYIHITDVSWLKATLLCFPGVRRMVPQSYVPGDSDDIKAFCDTPGPRGEPLLTSVDLFSPAARAAEKRLLVKLKEHDKTIRADFSQAVTMRTHRPEQLCQLHDEKIVLPLYNHLVSGKAGKALAWRIPPPPNRPHRAFGNWLALHPALGNAILSVKALTLANALGLDIVTDSTNVHDVVAAESEADIFEALLGGRIAREAPPAADTVDELSQIVMTTAFDVSRLSAKQIATLLADGHDLRRFKNALIPIAASLPPISDVEERRKRLKAAAKEVLHEWDKYKKSLPKFALTALVDAVELEWPKVVGTGGLLAFEQTWWLGAGLGVALLTSKGAKIVSDFREHVNGPYRYLSKIANAAAHTQAALSIAPPR
jgi:hypothetical protein